MSVVGVTQRAAVLALVVGSATAVAGCHGSVSVSTGPPSLAGSSGTEQSANTGPMISQDAVEHKAARILAAKAHQPVPTVVCPGNLAAELGATITCTLTPKGSTEQDPVLVTVKKLKHNGVYRLNFKVEAPSDPSSP